jgi:coenzyme F420-reducing hydrogenase alpha subunit
MVVGRPFQDIHHITSRICGICSIGHQLASLQATESALDVQVSEQTVILRKLALHAENLQSHLLHIGYLVLPDLLGVSSVIPLAQTHREELLNLIGARRISNEISECIGGRTTHPQSLVPGGMAGLPSEAEIRGIRCKIMEMQVRIDKVVELFAALGDKWPDFDRPTEYVALVSPSEYAFYRGELGSSRDKRRPVALYREVTNEYCVRQSTAKWAGNVEDSYMVGALARFNLNHELLGSGARAVAQKLGLKAPCGNPYMTTVAQLVECVHSGEDSLELLERLLQRGLRQEKPVPVKARAGRGVAAVEVPRGTLFHYYEYDDTGRVVQADSVIPTNQNHGNIQKDFDALAPTLAELSEAEIELKLSMLVRAYDPCISCSTHSIDLREQSRRWVSFVRV